MDVNKTNAVTPAGPGGPKQERKRGPEDEEQEKEKNQDGAAGGSPWEGTQAFAVDGLLADGVTPEIQKAFEGLASQIEPLRAEVQRARGREAHFKELAEKHSFLPVPGRREFLRELAHVLNNMEHLTPPPSLVLLHLVNADDIRRRLGRRALDSVLTHVCAVIDSTQHPTDVVGSLGGNDFGVILLVGTPDLARRKAEDMVEAIRAQPFPWQGETVTLEVIAGVESLQSGANPDSAITAADRNLIGGGPMPAAADGGASPTGE